MPRKNKGKGKRGKDPESSTPESSVNSVDDDTQQLLRSGAGASTDGRKSRADKKSEKDGRWTPQGNPSTYESLDATSSRNSPQSGPSTNPDSESSKNPSKKHSPSPLRPPWGKKSKSPSPGKECSCKAGNHKHECPKSKDLPVDPKEAFGGARPETRNPKKDDDGTKSSSSGRIWEAISKTLVPKRDKCSTKSSSSLTGARQTSDAKKYDGTQSSSSSDPSVAEYFASASESQQSSERSLLLDPSQGAEVRHEKTTHATRLRDKCKAKKHGKLSSGTESSIEENAKKEQRKHKKDQSKSLKGKTSNPKQVASNATSSSGSSTSTRNENNGASYKLPRFFTSKSPAKSDPKGKSPLKGHSGKSSNESKSNAGSSSISTDSEKLRYLAVREDELQGAVGGTEPEMQGGSTLMDRMGLGRRRRTSSRRTRSHLQDPEQIPPDPHPEIFDASEMSAEIEAIDWQLVNERNWRVENQDIEEEMDENQEIDAEKEMGENQEIADKSKDKKEQKKTALDAKERKLLKRLQRVERPDPRALRRSFPPNRLRPCSCKADEGKRLMGHKEDCDLWVDLQHRRRNKRNRSA